MALRPGHADLLEPSIGWYFGALGADGWQHFLPGFVRVTLSDPEQYLCVLVDRIRPDRVAILDEKRRLALLDVLEYCRACGYAADVVDRKQLRKALLIVRKPGAQAAG